MAAADAGEETVETEATAILEISPLFANLKVLPKPDERGDRNFPPHLHAACELFGMLGRVDCIKRCKKIVDEYIGRISEGPDPLQPVSIGDACVCWECGTVAIPSNASDCTPNNKDSVFGVCAQCGCRDQTNWIICKQTDGKVLPWIQLADPNSAVAEAAGAAVEAEKSPGAIAAPSSQARRVTKKVGPNDPCPCGSGKKFKKCGCGAPAKASR
mmetsp:Transcript_432/g.830  ORF Transcript_432/g.830 Transcript_432/m.830 type:complete len:214 (-) Transcript_432:106-747(-)